MSQGFLLTVIRNKLTEAKVGFTEEFTMSNGFHGTRFRFPRNELKKVEKALPAHIKAYHKEWCIEIF